MSARSRSRPWWLGIAQLKQRPLIAMTAAEIDVTSPLEMVTYPDVSPEQRAQFEKALKGLSMTSCSIAPEGGSYAIAEAHERVRRGR